MKVRIVCLIALIFLFVPFAAADMNINVRTLPNHLVSIIVLDPGYVYSLLDSYHLTSDSNGEVTAVYTGSKSEVRLLIKVSKEGQQVVLEKFNGTSFSTSEDLYLMVKPDETSLDYRKLDAAEDVAETLVNKSGNSTQNFDDVALEEANTSDKNGISLGRVTNGVSGFVLGVKDLFSKGFYVFVLVVVGIGALIFVVRRFAGRGYVGSVVKGIVKSSEAEHFSYDERVRKAEEKLDEAQKELEGLKKHSKIAAAERKLEEDKKSLERLKREEE